MHQIIGVMGPGEGASDSDQKVAYELGKLISGLGYTLLTGGRNCGVMEAALQGAKESSGITIGILPGNNMNSMSNYIDIPIITGMGNARNAINILSCIIVIVIGEGAGTISEVALALKSQKPVIWLNYSIEAFNYFKKFQNNPVFFKSDFNKIEIERLIKKLTSNT